MAEFPPIAELLPHAGFMALPSRVLAHAGDETRVEVVIAGQRFLRRPGGGVAAWATLEYAAQCIAVHSALVGRARGEPVRVGVLLGSRSFRFPGQPLAADRVLHVAARRLWGGERGPVAFDTEVADAADGASLAGGRLSCFTPEGGIRELLGGQD